MIDFKQKRFMDVSNKKMENLEVLEKYAATIRKDLEESKQNFFWLGVHRLTFTATIRIRQSWVFVSIMSGYAMNTVLICLSARETVVRTSFSHIALTSSGLIKRR